MSLSDAINAAYELSGGLFISFSSFKIWREKSSTGVHWAHIAFFTSWGFWNLYYYPSLGQWASTVGGIGVVGANLVWLTVCIRFRNTAEMVFRESNCSLTDEEPHGQRKKVLV